jgi:hypothetical protein
MNIFRTTPQIFLNWFDLDARSLSLFRVILSLGMIFDLANRLINFDFFYSNDGILPVDLWDEIWGSKSYYWSLHLSNSDQIVLFLIYSQLILAILLLLGVWVKFSFLISFFLMLSLVNRNPLLHYGGDKLLPLLLLCGFFLFFKNLKQNSYNNSFFLSKISSALLIAQIFMLYFVAGVAKLKMPEWWDGTALNNIFNMNMVIKESANWLKDVEFLLPVISILVPWFEMLFPILLLIPIFNYKFRTIGIYGLLTINLFISFTLDVGYFMPYATASILACLPPTFWNNQYVRGLKIKLLSLYELDNIVKNYLSIIFNINQIPSKIWSIIFTSNFIQFINVMTYRIAICLVVALTGIVIFTGIEAMGGWRMVNYPKFIWFGIRSINIYQKWDLFANPTNVRNWYVAKAKLKNGKWVDILQDGRGVSWAAQVSPNKLFKENSKWRVIFAKTTRSKSKKLKKSLTKALANKWNSDRPDSESVESLTLYFLQEKPNLKTSKITKTWAKWDSWP